MPILVRVLIAILIVALTIWLLPQLGPLPQLIHTLIILIVAVLAALWAFGRFNSNTVV